MAADLTAEQRAELEAIVSENGTGPDPDPPAGVLTPSGALQSAEVDLIELLRRGIPERAYVPGCDPWLVAGKRYLMPAPAGTGKSLATLVIAMAVVEAGGTVAILDVENGSDEYARRLGDVLEASGGDDGELARACVKGLRYYEWPRLSITWGPEEWSAALAGVDLVVFDSSRLMLSAAGLAEDSNDDYSSWVNALLVPLARAGSTTIVLDNTGHDERDRARGASAKADLNEVVYSLKVGRPFDRDRRGHLRLVLQRQRFAGLPGELHIPIGEGTYGPLEVADVDPDAAFRPTTLMARISEVVAMSPGIGKRELRDAVKGKNDAKDLALRLLVDEGYVSVEHRGQARLHHSDRPFLEGADPSLFGGPDD